MQFDELLKVIGEFGRYQQISVFLICLFALVCMCHNLSMVFLGATPDFHCKVSDMNFSSTVWQNLSDSQRRSLLIPEGEQCHQYDLQETIYLWNSMNFDLQESSDLWGSVNFDISNFDPNKTRKMVPCSNGYEYSKDEFKETVTSEFGLVCENRFLMTTSKTVYIFGQFCGALVIGQLSDRFGRRPVFVVGIITLLLAASIAAAAPNIYVFLVMYFFQGATILGVYMAAFVLMTEMVGPGYRVLVNIVVSLFGALGVMSLAGLAYLIRDWRYLEMTITLPVLFFAFYYFFLPESVPWLLSQGRTRQAEAIIKKVAAKNGVAVDSALVSSLKEDTTSSTLKRYNILDCVRTWRMAKLSVNIWFIWAVNAMVYYGLSMNAGNLSGSPYLNFCIAGAVEMPVFIICPFLLNRVGRRWPLVGFMYTGGVSCVLSGLIPTGEDSGLEILVVVLVMVGKFGITASYTTLYLWTAEIFPTVVRNVGIGVASTMARCGSVLSPVLVDLTTLWRPLPLVVFGTLSILAGSLAVLLPETMGRPLPQVPEDIRDEHTCQCIAGKTSEPDTDEL